MDKSDSHVPSQIVWAVGKPNERARTTAVVSGIETIVVPPCLAALIIWCSCYCDWTFDVCGSRIIHVKISLCTVLTTFRKPPPIPHRERRNFYL